MADADIAKLTLEQRRLLVAWRDILEDIRHLCRSLKVLPDDCACGDGRLHLSGSCVCCQKEQTNRGMPACEDCDVLLTKLRSKMDALMVDMWRFFPVAMDLLKPHQQDMAQTPASALERHTASFAKQAAADAIERHIAAVIRTFERLVVAAEEFRAGCRVSHLRKLKIAADDLLGRSGGVFEMSPPEGPGVNVAPSSSGET